MPSDLQCPGPHLEGFLRGLGTPSLPFLLPGQLIKIRDPTAFFQITGPIDPKMKAPSLEGGSLDDPPILL